MKLTATRSDLIYRVLHAAIIEQALQPGSKLPEDVIGAEFGVSRTIVRGVLARLATEGLVDVRPKRSATVARPSLDEAKEIFEVRRCLERQVVRLAAARWTPENGSLLEGHIREEKAAAESGSAAASVRLAGAFHSRLAAMAGNRLLQRYLDEVVSRCSLILALYGRPHSSECAINEHREIIAALRSGDVEKAVAIMDHHVEAVEKRALIKEGKGDIEALSATLARYAAPLRDREHADLIEIAPRRTGRGAGR